MPASRPGNTSGVSDETLGDIAAREVRAGGYALLDDFADVRRELLEHLPAEGLVLFATATAERLMRAHEALPEDEQAAYTLGWRPVLDRIWEWASGDRRAYDDVSRAVAEYLVSPQNHVDGQDGPSEADEDAAAAAIAAAECCTHAYPAFAEAVGNRALDAAYYRACEDERWKASHPELSDLAQDLAHPLVQNEIARQRADLEFLLANMDRLPGLFNEPTRPDVLEHLRR